MRVQLTRAFERQWRPFEKNAQESIAKVIRLLPTVVEDPHAHLGAGLRKLHPSGIWEARVGLNLCFVFAVDGDLLTLDRIGTHDEIRRSLKAL